MVTEATTEAPNDMTSNTMASNAINYSYLLTQYKPAYLSYAVLYGYHSSYSRQTSFFLRANTALSVLIAAIVGFTIGTEFTMVALLKGIGATVVGNLIIGAVNGSLTQLIDTWNYQLKIRDVDIHVPVAVASVGYITSVTTKVSNPNSSVNTYIDYISSGSYKWRQAFIDSGVYYYYLAH